MANIQNLKRYGKEVPPPTSEQARKSGQLGGINSGKMRKQIKNLKEIFEEWGGEEPNKNLIHTLNQFGISCENKKAIEALVAFAGLKLNEKRTSITDILKFIELYAKFTGQNPADKKEITGLNGSPIAFEEKVDIEKVKEFKEMLGV